MAKVTRVLPIFPAARGLDKTSIVGTSHPASMVNCDNLIFSINGSRKKFWGLNTYYRSGFTPTISNDMRGIYDYWRNSSGVQVHKVVAFAGGKLWADAADGRFVDVTGTSSLVVDDAISFDVFAGYLIACFEGTVPFSWNMTGNFGTLNAACVAATGQALPGGGAAAIFKFCRIHRRRLWLAGNPLYPNVIYYSAPDNPLDWQLASGAGSISIDAGDSDPIGINGIFPSFYDDLYVPKRRSLYRVKEVYAADLGSSIFQLQPVVKGIGCIAHNSAVATPNDIIWASERGIHSLAATDRYGDVDATFLSFPIHEYYQEGVNFLRSENMWGVYDPEANSYWLAYTQRGANTNNALIAYNISMKELYTREDFDCAAMCSYVDSRFKSRTLVGTESLNIGVYDPEIVDDFGEGKSMSFSTPVIYPLGSPHITCGFKVLWLFLKPQETGTINVTYQIDGKTTQTVSVDQTGVGSSLIGTAVIGTAIIGGTGDIKKVAVPLVGEGSGIQFVFSNIPDSEDTNEDCEIYGYVLEYEYYEDSALPSVTTQS